MRYIEGDMTDIERTEWAAQFEEVRTKRDRERGREREREGERRAFDTAKPKCWQTARHIVAPL